jgi:hypothetical protein
VRTPDLAQPERFAALVGSIVAAAEKGPRLPLHLDLSNLMESGPVRLRPLSLLVLSNLLLGKAGRTPVRLTMPRSDNARLSVMRSGLLFSLLARPCPVGAHDLDGLARSDDVIRRWIELWRMPWSPREPTLGRLFDDGPRPVDTREFAGPDGVLQKPNNAKQATRVVVDPHLRLKQFLLEQAARGIAGTWLQAITPSSSVPELADRRRMWINLLTSRVLAESLANVTDHAFTAPLDDPARPFDEPHSLVLLARTDGGQGSYPRLQVLVVDNGYGLVRTLRPKLAASNFADEREMANRTAVDVLRYAVQRPAKTASDPGLPWVRDAFTRAVDVATGQRPRVAMLDRDTELLVVTGSPDDGDTVWARVDRSGRTTCGRIVGAPFQGTTVFATLPIPHESARRAPRQTGSAAVAVHQPARLR